VAGQDTGRVYYYEGQPSCKYAIAVSALTTTLNIKQPNVIQVIKFRKSSDPFIIIDYYKHGNIAEADIAYDQYAPLLGR
jgi:hypothetical protein